MIKNLKLLTLLVLISNWSYSQNISTQDTTKITIPAGYIAKSNKAFNDLERVKILMKYDSLMLKYCTAKTLELENNLSSSQDSIAYYKLKYFETLKEVTILRKDIKIHKRNKLAIISAWILREALPIALRKYTSL